MSQKASVMDKTIRLTRMICKIPELYHLGKRDKHEHTQSICCYSML